MIFVKISQNFIKSHLKIALSNRFQSTAYGMCVYDFFTLKLKNLMKKTVKKTATNKQK